MKLETEQEKFWAGHFGDEYVKRNEGDAWIASNTAFFTQALKNVCKISSVLELGANIGLNLHAFKRLFPKINISAVEINEKAILRLKEIEGIEIHHQSILDFSSAKSWDMIFTKGVLIHIDPDKLTQVYELMHQLSNRYILICEYYNPKPVEIVYRGHSNKLFKRDFAGEMLDRFSDLVLLDYGFVYHRDNNFPQDDMTWFLLEKRS